MRFDDKLGRLLFGGSDYGCFRRCFGLRAEIEIITEVERLDRTFAILCLTTLKLGAEL